jgi:hypothetical protein
LDEKAAGISIPQMLDAIELGNLKQLLLMPSWVEWYLILKTCKYP